MLNCLVMKRKKSSNKIYKYFSNVETNVAICKHCGQSLMNDKFNLRRHLRRKHNELFDELQNAENGEKNVGNDGIKLFFFRFN